MTTTDLDAVAANDPATDAAQLGAIAAMRPDLQATIAAHPNAYDGLLDWIATYGPPDAQRAVSLRRAPARPEMPPSPSTSADVSASEPSFSTDAEVSSATPAPTASTPASRNRLWITVGAIAVIAIVAGVFAVTTTNRNREAAAASASPAAAAEAAAAAVSVAIQVSSSDDTQPLTSGVKVLVRNGEGEQLDTLYTDSDGSAVFTYLHGGLFLFSVDQASVSEGFGTEGALNSIRIDDGAYESLSLTVTAPAVIAAPPPPASGPNATWTFSTPSGYTYDMTITVSAPVTSGSNGSRSLSGSSLPNTIGSVCTDFDSATDVAIPVQVTITAKTKGFETPISAAFTVGHPYGMRGSSPATFSSVVVESEHFYSNDTECNSWPQAGVSGVSWPDPLVAGASATDRFTVIVRNYRSPNAPAGDAAILNWIAVTPQSSSAKSTAVGTFTKASGPSAITLAGTAVE